jgi:Rha family phage regulatory protein
MNELITIKKDKAVTSSLRVAEIFHKNHAHVLRDIECLDCSSDFRESNFGLSSYKSEQNKKLPMYYMTKDGFAFLVMGYRGKKAAKFKEDYINAFNLMENTLKEKQTAAWIETRQQGKLTRKAETDIIKKLVEYAKEQGSTHADMLYVTYTKLANKIIGVKHREDATTMQLNNLSLAEHIIKNVIDSGIQTEMNYKDIYKESKKRLELFSDVAMLEVAI